MDSKEESVEIVEDQSTEKNDQNNKKEDKTRMFFPQEIGFTKVCWSQNRKSSSWFAAGNFVGFVRIQRSNLCK